MALFISPNFTPDIKIYTSSATWTKPSGATFVYVKALGGGGGGGAASVTVPGFGGGGSGLTEYLFLASDLPSSISITIGSGGTAGTAATNGGDGTGTTFGTYLRSGRGLGGQTGGAITKSNGSVSGSMGVITSAGASTMNQLNTMTLGTGSYGCTANNIRHAYDCLYGAAGGGIGGTSSGFISGNGGAGFWATLSTSVDMVSPLESSTRAAGTAIGNGALAGTGGTGANGAAATRLGNGGGGGDYNTAGAGGTGGAGYLGGGGGGGGVGSTAGGNGGAGGGGYCLVYSW